jgi:hypothetical protein
MFRYATDRSVYAAGGMPLSPEHDAPSSTGPRLRAASLEAALAIGGANLIAELGIYALVIVPRLGSVPRVPIVWWAGMYAPVLIACALVAWRLRSASEVVAAALGSGIVAQIEKWGLALAHAPGHAKSLAFEDPARFWSVLHALARIHRRVAGVRKAR